jgi:phage-related protein (TIGR01555 family)
MTDPIVLTPSTGGVLGRIGAVGNVVRKITNDGWTNILTGLGIAGRDKRVSTDFAQSYTLSREELAILYEGDDVCALACDLLPAEMFREWIRIPIDRDGKIEDKLSALGVRQKFEEASVWGRLYGGAGIVVGVSDGKRMDQPLDFERVRSIDWLTVLDRHELYIDSKYSDPRSAKFGEPEYYTIRTVGDRGPTWSQRVHESRVISFPGARTSRQKKAQNSGWDDSIIQKTFDVIRDYNAVHSSSAQLAQDFAQAVYKIKGLADMLSADDDEDVLKRLAFLDLARSVARAIPLDAESEEFERKTTPVTGLPDLIDRQTQRLSLALGIPVSRLIGTSPGGLNNTGENEQRNLNNAVRAMQATVIRPRLSWIIDLVAREVGVKPEQGDHVAWTFAPLWQPTAKEQAETRKITAETDKLYIDAGVIDAVEVAESRFGGDEYGTETVLDRDVRKEDDSEGEKQDEVNMTDAINLVARVHKREIPRDSGVQLLVSIYGFDADTADRIMGEAGRGEPPPVAAPVLPGIKPPAPAQAAAAPKVEP